MPHRSQSSSVGDNPLDPNYLPPHYREEYRLAIDVLIEHDIQGYFEFLQTSDLVGFLSQSEIEYIKSTLQGPSQSSGAPELTYYEGGQDAEGSSDTYWPLQSDTAAPGLDLGWPLPQHSFIGPTEVTTLVNPCDSETPSIKEQARRLIKNARHVIAIVMDMFTDVDIFGDLLEAAGRHVPVYILLDERNAPHFVNMVMSCKVNLDLIQMMRVRTVAGVTYYSRTGKSFKGQVKDRFLLTDCRAVLSGNYSFMWSYEKIHRCIAHLFLGELVTTFDEEFRILFAQSEPLIIDPSSGPLTIPDPGTSSYKNTQFGLKRSQSLRNPGFRRQPEMHSAFPYGELDRNTSLPFRRNDTFRHTLEPSAGITIGKYSQQQFRLQQSYLEQGKSIVSRQMELSSSAFKRHSYAEGTQENYSSSRQYMKHRVMNNLDETDFHREQISSSHYYSEGPGPGSGHGHYDRLRAHHHLPIDQYSESSFHSDREPPPGIRDYFSSEDLRGPEGLHAPHVAGRYGGGSASQRPTIGQAYACQRSPTHLHPPEKGHFQKQSDQEYDQDPSVKQGMRSWRIHSYLSTYEDGGEEGLPQPMGHDAFEDPPPGEQLGSCENLASHFRLKDPPTVPPKPRPDILKPRFGKPKLPDSNNQDSTPTASNDVLPSFSDWRSSVLEKRDRIVEREKERESERGSTRNTAEDLEVKEAPDIFLSRHESIRSRVNPLLQRSSRLRSSLIFSSSKAEMHSGSLGLKPATEEDDQLDTIRTSSLVAQILEKRRSFSREPFEWRKKAEDKDNVKEKEEREEKVKEKEKENEKKEQQKKEQENKSQITEKEETHSTKKEEKIVSAETIKVKPSVNVNDPASRLQYFKDLENKRKASKMETEQSQKALEPAEKKPDLSEKVPLCPDTTPPKTSSVAVTSTEQEPKKPDIAAKLAELSRRTSVSSVKPSLITPKPFGSSLKLSETLQLHKKENETESQKKDDLKSLKPPPSPKLFRKDQLKIKSLSLNPRRISCDDVLTKDATDAEKSEMKKNRSHSSSTLPHEESKEGLHKGMGSNTSLNTIGEGKGDGKTLEFLKKQTQRLKGFLGPKDKEKKASGDDRGMSTVMEVADDSSKKGSSAKVTTSATTEQPATNHKESAGKSSSSRYQASGNSALYSSNLRDDTKVILEQISANSQKNRQEREEPGGDKDSGAMDKGQETQNPFKKNRFLRPQSSNQEREGLLKRIESLRKEKKVYSRFEMGNSLA
ncbi:protein FAM83H [Poecilia reticulata]|uniref:Family with sequence similarity 83 member Hb n=1 Tax=Poecilia reticulata TaxID=8081 RepID=A0A3P9NM21_POERE|nr:PREDICTED: protein FAM83H [Poecilia reticulata]XP_008420210.1 PREDICTED: protein FAM83H [Poecilia reticulata]XP_008420211.1 PREDICTED: protein FAM83H [Poecilia reticulata]